MSNYDPTEVSDEISFAEIKIKIKSWLAYLKQYWLKFLLIGLIGGVLGFLYAYILPKNYKAKLSFVVEEGKSTTGGLASLAGQFGIDLGTASGSGLLSGENLLLFLKSTSLTKDVLLTPYDTARNYSLADKYADVYQLKEKWLKNKIINKQVNFPVKSKELFTRQQDSLLADIVENILKKAILVERPEKKATFITVETNLRDELLSKFYCERLVQKAIDRYVQSKIKRLKINVDRLQLRSDSIESVLNNKTYKSAFDQERVLDVNPGSRTATVNAEVSTRDKMMLTTIYGEVIKNLEIAKVQLNQETPTIQIVDDVTLPLKKVKPNTLFWILAGIIATTSLYVFFSRILVKII
jgi:uncharacterized protein involved in exopolysaccharide biosynthesis